MSVALSLQIQMRVGASNCSRLARLERVQMWQKLQINANFSPCCLISNHTHLTLWSWNWIIAVMYLFAINRTKVSHNTEWPTNGHRQQRPGNRAASKHGRKHSATTETVTFIGLVITHSYSATVFLVNVFVSCPSTLVYKSPDFSLFVDFHFYHFGIVYPREK